MFGGGAEEGFESCAGDYESGNAAESEYYACRCSVCPNMTACEFMDGYKSMTDINLRMD